MYSTSSELKLWDRIIEGTMKIKKRNHFHCLLKAYKT
jgi:hypothetical protein